MAKRKSKQTFAYTTLERKELLAGVSIETVSGRVNVVIDGTSSNDTAVVRDAAGGMVEFEFNNTTTQFSRSAFERIRFLGRSGNDSFVNNTDIDSAIIGHAGNDTLTGGDGNNWIQGGDGQDTLTGGSRNDSIRGGNGNDTIYGGHRHDRIFGGDGDDDLRGQQGNDYINGEAGADLIVGGSGNDRMVGEAGADRMWGGIGDDRAEGGAGNDVLNFDAGTDTALYDSAFAQYEISGSIGALIITATTSAEGQDAVNLAESLRFSDGPTAAEPNEINLNEAEQASYDLLNSLRSSQNLSALTSVNDLNEFARNWSLEMSRTGFRHSTLSDRAHLVVGNRTTTTENIAFSPSASMTAAEAARTFHDLWVNSSTHYAHMIDSAKTEVGIGLVQTSEGWFGTHVFADG